MENVSPYTLTPADIMDLRASISHRGSADGTNGHFGAAFIVYIPSDDAWALHAYGQVWAESGSITVLGQMLKCERAEAGFIRRVLSSTEPCDIAALSPDLAAARRARAAAENRRVLEYQQAERERVARRASAIDPSKLTLDDI